MNQQTESPSPEEKRSKWPNSDSLGVVGRRILIATLAAYTVIFIVLATLTQLRPDLWFVKNFLTGGKLWIWGAVLLFGAARLADWLHSHFKNKGDRVSDRPD